MTYNTLVVLAGTSLLGAGAGLVGTFAVLRGRALLGDALAHAALPGVCLGFLVWGDRSLPVMLLGALATGMAGVALVGALSGLPRVKSDAAMGMVLSVFFGAGLVLSRLIQSRHAGGSKAGLDSYILGKTAGMLLGDVYLILGVSLIALVVTVLLYKEFKLVTFDPEFALVQGWPAAKLELLLMGMLAVMVVLGLPAAGAVLVVALLILPAGAARFWTDRLGWTLAVSSGLGMLMGAAGTLASARWGHLPAGPMIVLAGTAVFVISGLIAPRKGLLVRWLRRGRWQLPQEGLA
jgi:manganese/zinc/iron transport system permease protein